MYQLERNDSLLSMMTCINKKPALLVLVGISMIKQENSVKTTVADHI